MFNLIYSTSISNNGFILGVNNDLYVKLKKDMEYFKSITSNKINNKTNSIIMGYNTWVSLNKKPLENRINIVITSKHYDELSGQTECLAFKTMDDCIDYLKSNDMGTVFVIGGSILLENIYKDYFHLVDTMYVTHIICDDFTREEKLSYKENNVSTLQNYIVKLMCHDMVITEIKGEKHYEDGLIYDFVTNTYISKLIHFHFRVFQKNELINYYESNYLLMLKNISEKGAIMKGRNGITMSSFGHRMEFDLTKSFPILTTKRIGWKTVLRELMWFISGSTDNETLNDKGVHIWDANASKEFMESRQLDHYIKDDLGPVYGFQWRHFGAEYKDSKTDYTGQGFDQLQFIIDEIKKNPNSRRLILNSWNAADIDKMSLPPCHVMVQFYIDNDCGYKFIDAQLYQRSGDMFLGVPFNITSYAFLLSIIGHLTGYKPRKLIHVLGDAHVYTEHMEAVNKQLTRIPNQFPTLKISDELTDIDDIKEEHFLIENYNHYTGINAPMIA